MFGCTSGFTLFYFILFNYSKSLFICWHFQGFGDRLLSEIKKLAPKDVKIRVSNKSTALFFCSFLFKKFQPNFYLFYTDICTSRTSVLHLDWRINPCILGHIQTNVGVQARVWRRGTQSNSKKNILDSFWHSIVMIILRTVHFVIGFAFLVFGYHI